jgi:hypothetical protein
MTKSNVDTKKFLLKSWKFLKFIRFKIFASSFLTQNILIFVEIQFRSEVFLYILAPWSTVTTRKKSAKTAVGKVLYFCLNFKLSELNRLIVLHKSAQN